MRITTDHAASSYGIPVILDDDGKLLDPGPGFRAVRERLGLKRHKLAPLVGVSERTIEGWEQGLRAIPANAIIVLAQLLEEVKP